MSTEDRLAWTRRYRPTTLTEYVGNEQTKSKIRLLNQKNRLPQTILLEGERGTGKTTLARLIAKNLMCHSPFEGDACGKCESCEQLDDDFIVNGKAPRNMSVDEIDITKMNTREHATTIVAKMSKRSFRNEKRVFILDEMQRATSEAQSSFLKITEEPIEGLYIILCTTDPEDLLTPFKSRFNRFIIRRPTNKDIVGRLEHICRKEGVNYSKEGLRLLAERSGNNPRETINKAELIGMTGDLTRKSVEKELHIINQEIFHEFLDGCMEGNLSKVVLMLEDITTKESLTVTDFVPGLGQYLSDLLNARSGVKLDAYSADDIKDMRKYVKSFTDEQMIGMLRTLKEYSDIKTGLDFHMLTLAVSFMEVLKIDEKVEDVNPSEAGAKFQEVTKKVRESKVPKKLNPASEKDIMALFNGAEAVKLEGGDKDG